MRDRNDNEFFRLNRIDQREWEFPQRELAKLFEFATCLRELEEQLYAAFNLGKEFLPKTQAARFEVVGGLGHLLFGWLKESRRH